MKIKRSLFGYSIKEVEQKLIDYENLIDLQRRDIEYLKRDNDVLKSAVSSLGRNEK